MATRKRVNHKTPMGGDYSEIYYLNEDGHIVDESLAVKCVIRECTADGSLICETWGFVNAKKRLQNES